MRLMVFFSVSIFLLPSLCFSQKQCVTEQYTRQLLSHPGLKINKQAPALSGSDLDTRVAGIVSEPEVIIIPVVVHVVYSKEEQNISAARIKSQIEILNKDYRQLNADAVNIPLAFKALAADAHIEFRLAAVDPNGAPTSGIVCKKTTVAFFGIDDRIKSSVMGGDNAWDSEKYLNIWSGNLSEGIIGYASSPGGPADKDGVVIRYNAFGNTGNMSSPYNKGRTATHEIGHWLGLRHIWGDAPCGDDNIDDTPPQASPNRGCPSGIVASCDGSPNGSMYMNFMDFTNDECLSMFTKGQAKKMMAAFNVGGARHNLALSDAANGFPLEEPGDPDFSSAGEIEIYPNPVKREATIRFGNQDKINNGNIIIYNPLGQVVRQTKITGPVMKLNLADLTEGLYYISAGNKEGTKKFIKVKM